MNLPSPGNVAQNAFVREFAQRIVRKNSEQRMTSLEIATPAGSGLAPISEIADAAGRTGLLLALIQSVSQPLTAMAAEIATLRERLLEDPSDLSDAQSSVERIASVFRGMRETAERAKSLMVATSSGWEDCDLNQLVEQVVSSVQAQSPCSRLAFDLSLDPTLPPLAIDRAQVRKTIVELIRNAAESMMPGREPRAVVTIATGFRHGETHLRVTDHGLGVEDHERIFDLFHSTKPGRLGAGLSMCRSFAVANGGELRAEPNPAKGTSIVLTFFR